MVPILHVLVRFSLNFTTKFSPQHPLSVQEKQSSTQIVFTLCCFFERIKKNEIDQDIVVASVTFVIDSNFVLILWMGKNQKLYFTREFGNREIIKKKKGSNTVSVDKPLCKNFYIGTFLMHSVQKNSQQIKKNRFLASNLFTMPQGDENWSKIIL